MISDTIINQNEILYGETTNGIKAFWFTKIILCFQVKIGLGIIISNHYMNINFLYNFVLLNQHKMKKKYIVILINQLISLK